MIKLIVGLGNPGRQYEKTRHNAGFLFLDRLVSQMNCSWVVESRFDGVLAQLDVAGGKVMLLKPTTFMNRSGQAVGKVARYYKLAPEEILVVHDELDFDVGVVKLKKNGGHAGHNGLRDIIAHLASKDFYRLRVGIGRPSVGMVVADFVLSPPSKAELALILSVFDDASGFVGQMAAGEMSAVMNKLNA
ncbi:MAG: aminoacyl-tRNA hydrolase [Methylobacter sp.]|nr:aminoacyl-tRNA hydrolase [Methylobacter sp.]MDP2100666.1 aminoacyl-tRNA hydrolase [Methylobacter sp.]MDP2428093.1 aminoacyl-tRNA hydrolase [Methylobacter sp.]MDP3054439.1 aminoacyl-tRNA hydrolase [Methylobacter sp.]MDP3362547.1 aminoacyl-tRNA hydrolase [Methylobacter sp.]